ncbi:FG-GAP-like repeat-containing protein [Granulicella sibirica]|uniref:ASPIC/UnbV domain-containing protein n=1 Tax=Granulicella sibirica TaxID=2479048 RepID=A0A4Q0SXS8_9BACT|nr:FG-GAP-like repeat-containing protein [Granulicella sibirica]RXH54219.1 ASPIC/UnbV domain-containing protein [Granulicella sibirica]
MAGTNDAIYRLNRRSLIKQLGLAPLLLRPAAFSALAGRAPHMDSYQGGPQPFSDVRYLPQYPVRSPLEDVLRLVRPGSDAYPTEEYAAQIEAILAVWGRSMQAGDLQAIVKDFAPRLEASPLTFVNQTKLRDKHGVACFKRSFGPVQTMGAHVLATSLREWIGVGTHLQQVEFQLTSLEEHVGDPRMLLTSIRYNLTIEKEDRSREQRVGSWRVIWSDQKTAASETKWITTRLEASTESAALVRGGGFVDVSHNALGANASYGQQLRNGSDYWRTVLDGASGIDVYGNNGVAVGDYNNDGFDDLYVSQPAGLPNRLYRNRGDGTFEDVTEKAGVGVLDNTACALFADFRNIGLQDLLVVCGSGPLLFLNQGDETFRLKPDAFRFLHPPQGTFTHAAVSDYDRDGRLDIYFCLYSYYLGLDQYHYPTPYFDARNGPPNFLMHNEGDGTFTDRTEAAGLNRENDRYSFACAWQENAGNSPDLYVVNDFGRNNLYRNKGNGTFEAVSAAAHVQDVGAGMSAAWADYANTGRPGIYAANMWSAAGQRVSQLQPFHSSSTPAVRELYQRHARGNALYRSEPDGAFTNVSEEAGVEMGRWAWGSDFFDFDRDGHADLYVTNGYITAPQTPSAPTSDLDSFFWRQVVGRSPDDASPSLAYERGWNALNELIRTDSSWSGHERNVALANNGDGTFTEVSGPLGLDFLEDGRSFALSDLDGDGRLEIILKNRNGPQIRILHNNMEHLGDAIAFRLRGTHSNRDAIGTVITLHCGDLVQTRSLQAGSGFLSQHTKELFFGLGNGTEPIHANIRWPSGESQQFHDLPRNTRIQIVEADPSPRVTPFAPTAETYTHPSQPVEGQTIPTTIATWLLDPLKAPAFTLPNQQGIQTSLDTFAGRPVLLHLWSTANPTWQTELRTLDTIPPATLTVLALNLGDPAPEQHMRFHMLKATAEVGGIYNIVFRYLFDRRTNLPLPTSFLLDVHSMIVRIYQGPINPQDLLADLRLIPTTTAARTALALPFPGTLYQGSFHRNDFTFGVAMFQHGYLDQAAASFQQVIADRPNDAEAHYNLGTLSLRRNDFPSARQHLKQTLVLKPDYPEAWNNLGMMAAQEGQTQEAHENFNKSLALRPNYPTALLNLGNLYRHERNFPEAQTYLTRALALQPDDPETDYSLGMLFAQQSLFPAAEEYLQKAIALRPDYPEALNNLGVLYVRQGDNARGEQQFLTCMRLSPAYEGTYLNLGSLYLTQGDKPRARKVIQDLLRLNPQSSAAKKALQTLDE